MAAAAEAGSEHPIARAVVRGAEERGLDVPAATTFRTTAGLGVRATVSGEDVVVGRRRFLEREGVDLPSTVIGEAARLEARGETAVLVAWGGVARGVVGVADTVRPGAAAAVQALRRMGVEPVMVTGDAEAPARTAAAEVGIERVVAEVLPEGKVEVVRRLQEEGRTVAVVGDGVNDGPALAEADLGVAVGTGTDVAIEASDMTLMRGDPAAVVTAIRLARRTFRTIVQNLAWAFGYNVVLIPLAAAGLLDPILAAAAMALSSVSVVSNSLRLRRFA
jgi:Cu+-exporting ATPase